MKLNVEQLETRATPSAVLKDGVLTITGTDGPDRIIARQSNILAVNGERFAASDVKSIEVNALGGNDTIDLRGVRVPAKVDAGAGNDLVWGTNAADVLHGGDGNDELLGMGGIDAIFGDAGNDFMDDGNRSLNEPVTGGDGNDFNADVWIVDGARAADVAQRGSPNCCYLATIASLVETKRWAPRIRFAGTDGYARPIYTVWMGANAYNVVFDGKAQPLDPATVTEGESWVTLYNRAEYVWLQSTLAGRFVGSQVTGTISAQYTVSVLTGAGTFGFNRYVPYGAGVYEHAAQSNSQELYAKVVQALAQHKAVMASTHSSTPGVFFGGWTAPELVSDHCYSVLAVVGNNVLVRNPWGYDNWRSPTWGNPDDGVVLVSWDRLFRSTYEIVTSV